MVMDARTGEVLHSRNADTRLHPASLTKMMTLYIAFEAVRLGEITLDTEVEISQNADAEPPSHLGLRAGSTIRFRFLIRAAAVRSANDAATAIAEAISGSEEAFAARMNRTAQALGMTNTTFRNAHGLTADGHLSTARDMTIMGRRLFFDYPQYYNIFSRRSTDAGIATVRNTNSALLNAYEGADGIKTGYTRAAGYNLVASAQRGNERIIATVFGGRSTATRNRRIMELFDMGFDRAPTNAPVRTPALPVYEGLPFGRMSRASGTVDESLRPMQRPGPQNQQEDVPIDDPDLLVSAISDVVTQVVMADTAQPPVMPPQVQFDAPPAVVTRSALPRDRSGSMPQAQILPISVVVAQSGPVSRYAVPVSLRPVMRAGGVNAAPQSGGGTSPVAMVQAPSVAMVQAPVIDMTRPAAMQPAPNVVAPNAAAPDPNAPDPNAIVVARSTSTGSRIYGVSLGALASYNAAERLLLRTALSDMGVFNHATRHVVQGRTGYEARFEDMTYDQARLACSRLSSRGIACQEVGPS
jgi:D-alanyl-D-alanine carboxypeptidase